MSSGSIFAASVSRRSASSSLPFACRSDGVLLQAFDGRFRIAELDAGACAGQPRLEVGAVEIAETDAHFGFAARVAARAAALGQQHKIGARVDEQPLTRRDVAEMPHRPLFVGLDLQNFLVERDRLGKEPFVCQMRGDVVALRDGLVDLTAAEIEVSQRVGSIPVGGLILDDRAVLRDGQIELPLAEQLLRFAERSLAIKWHRQQS